MPAGEQYQGASDFQTENGTLPSSTKGVGMGAFNNCIEVTACCESLNVLANPLFPAGICNTPNKKYWTTIMYRVRDAKCTSPKVKFGRTHKEDMSVPAFHPFSLNVFLCRQARIVQIRYRSSSRVFSKLPKYRTRQSFVAANFHASVVH